MAWDLYLTFLAATILVLVSPGPTVMLVVGYALSHGRRSALATVAGVGLGDLTALCCSLAGLGALLAAWAGAFTVLKWIGAAYLVYLGVKMWRNGTTFEPGNGNRRSPRAMLGHAYVVTALNPKSMVFFVAFLPQFILPERPLWPQLPILGGTFLVLAVTNTALYALLAGGVRKRLTGAGVQRVLGRLGGSVLIGAGLMTAALRRS